VAAGVSGDVKAAEKHFQAIADETVDGIPWVKVLKERAAALHRFVEDTPGFRAQVNEIIRRARAALKLPPLGSHDVIET